MGRFINADALTTTGQGLLGNNMFAYCNNNPVCCSDPTGYWCTFGRISNPNAMMRGGGCYKGWIIPDIEREKAEQENNKKVGTAGIGFTFSAFEGAGGSISVGIAVDRHWNIGFSFTPAAGGGFPSVGAVGYASFTNAPTVFDLAGWSGQVGGSVNILGASAGLETAFFSNPAENESYQGLTFSVGGKAALPCELHGTLGYTYFYGFNVFDAFISFGRILSS